MRLALVLVLLTSCSVKGPVLTNPRVSLGVTKDWRDFKVRGETSGFKNLGTDLDDEGGYSIGLVISADIGTPSLRIENLKDIRIPRPVEIREPIEIPVDDLVPPPEESKDEEEEPPILSLTAIVANAPWKSSLAGAVLVCALALLVWLWRRRRERGTTGASETLP